MFKYIKWELKSLMKRYTKILIVFASIIGLMAIVPLESDNFLAELVSFAFIIMLMILMLSTFVFGTKKVIDTFRKPTFMLESMISFPPYKILLAKYLLAIILNTICTVLLILSISVVVYRTAGFTEVLEMLNIDLNFDTLETLITILITSTLFTSTVTLCYVLAKSLFPKGKGAVVLGIVIWYIGICFLGEIFESFNIDSVWFFNIIELAIISLCYLGTVKLIENKLEIYN